MPSNLSTLKDTEEVNIAGDSTDNPPDLVLKKFSAW